MYYANSIEVFNKQFGNGYNKWLPWKELKSVRS